MVNNILNFFSKTINSNSKLDKQKIKFRIQKCKILSLECLFLINKLNMVKHRLRQKWSKKTCVFKNYFFLTFELFLKPNQKAITIEKFNEITGKCIYVHTKFIFEIAEKQQKETTAECLTYNGTVISNLDGRLRRSLR